MKNGGRGIQEDKRINSEEARKVRRCSLQTVRMDGRRCLP
jgi:hypothetical protein